MGIQACGCVFSRTVQNGWTYTSLHDFSGPGFISPVSNGSFDSQGNLWGTASTDGHVRDGGVWEIIP